MNEKAEQWHNIFDDPLLSISSLKGLALSGSLAQCGLRSVFWRLFLDVLPAPHFPLTTVQQAWLLALERSRNDWNSLKLRFLTNPDGNSIHADDTRLLNNPLSLEPDSPWSIWFADMDIRKEIQKDVERTFPDVDFFRSVQVQDQLTNLLQVWTKLNPDVGYRQGMHELLAPILWMVTIDALPLQSSPIPSSSRAPPSPSLTASLDLMRSTLDPSYIEHDTWTVFQKVMASAKSWFDPNLSVPLPMTQSKQATWIDPTSQRFQVVQPIIALSVKIQSTLLRQVDPTLSSKLAELQIEPQMYCLRWLRVLFSREMPWQEVLVLWDCILAEDPTLRITEWVCVAMLLRIREELLVASYSGALQLLLRYPEPEDEQYRIPLLFKQAVTLRDNPSPSTASITAQENHSHRFFSPSTIATESPPTSSTVPQHRKFRRSSVQPSPYLYSRNSFQPPALVGDLARNVYDRAEALGINKAVKETFGELKKNVSYYQAALASSAPGSQTIYDASGFPQGVTAQPFQSAQQQARIASELRGLKASNADCSSAIGFCVNLLERPNNDESATQLILATLKHLQDVLIGEAVYDSQIIAAVQNLVRPPRTVPSANLDTGAVAISPIYLAPRRTGQAVSPGLPRVAIGEARSPKVTSQPSVEVSSSSADSSPTAPTSYPPSFTRTVYTDTPASKPDSFKPAPSLDPLGVLR